MRYFIACVTIYKLKFRRYKMLIRLVAGIVTVIMFVGCSNKISVGVAHAKTEQGFINTSQTPIGTLYVVDTNLTEKKFWRETEINTTTDKATPTQGEHIASNIEKGLKVDFDSGDLMSKLSKEAKANIGLKVLNSTKVILKNYKTNRFRSSYTALNSSENMDVRKQISEQYGVSPRYKYVLVSGVWEADEANITVGYKPENNKFTISLKNTALVDASVTNNKGISIKGKNVPVLFNVDIFKLERSNGATGYRFVRDNSCKANLTDLFNSLN